MAIPDFPIILNDLTTSLFPSEPKETYNKRLLLIKYSGTWQLKVYYNNMPTMYIDEAYTNFDFEGALENERIYP